MSYTYEQVLAYEVARELINSHVADYSEAIAVEKTRTRPRVSRLVSLRERQTQLVVERRRLRMTEDAGVADAIARYRR